MYLLTHQPLFYIWILVIFQMRIYGSYGKGLPALGALSVGVVLGIVGNALGFTEETAVTRLAKSSFAFNAKH